MKESLKELLREKPNSIGCIFVKGKSILYLQYSAKNWHYKLHFLKDDLLEIEMICDDVGETVMFGESIGTDRDILNEISFEIHPSIIEHKSQMV